MKGEEQDDPRAFPKQKVWKRFITVVAGPLMNFVLAFVVLTGLYLYMPVTEYPDDAVYRPYVTAVTENSPAEQAGLQVGDIVAYINDTDIQQDLDPNNTADCTFSNMISAWKEGDTPLHFQVLRLQDEVYERV